MRAQRVQPSCHVPHQRQGAHRDVVRLVLKTPGADHAHDRIERHRAPLEQPEPTLDLEHAAHRLLEPLRRDPARRHGRRHGGDRGIGIGRHQQQVGAREKRPHGGLSGAVFRHDGAHHQRIGHHEAREAQRVPQQAGQHRRREGARLIRAGEGGKRDVRAHHHIRPGGDARAERHELERVEPGVPRSD